MLDDLFTYRLARALLTVTNAANHDKDLAWFSARRGLRRHVIDVTDRLRDARRPGPGAREIVQGLADGPLPARMTAGARHRRRRDALVCGTGYTGEDGVELLLDPADAPTSGTRSSPRRRAGRARRARHAAPGGLLPPLRQRPVEERGPIEAGLGWCCKEDTGFIGADAVRPRARPGRPRSSSPFKLDRPGIARQGNPVVGGGEVTSGTHSPSLGIGIGMAYLPAERASAGERFEIDVRGKNRRRWWPRSRSTPRRPMADASYPDDLLYHAEHDWARIDGDTATFGITWFAQDALGEVVFFDPPEVGPSVTAASPTPRSSPSRPCRT